MWINAKREPNTKKQNSSNIVIEKAEYCKKKKKWEGEGGGGGG